VRRFRNGKKAPPQFQRSDAEDLLATVFPDQLACAENLPGGDIEIPDHPLVAQTLGDCMHRAMDIEGLEALLARIESGATEVACRELASPSPLAQEILGAKPYAFLDDAPAEERRTLAVQARRFMSPEQAADLGRLDAAAIERVRAEAWPDARNADELHDALVLLGFMTADEAQARGLAGSAWETYFAELCVADRATEYTRVDGARLWVAAERLAEVELVFPKGAARPPIRAVGSTVDAAESALCELVRSRLEAQGPVTSEALARLFGCAAAELAVPLAALEQQGIAMRGRFTGAPAEEWCERRLLARIHRYTLNRLRSEIEPVSLADYQRFLFEWQGLGDARREGREALRAVLAELEGLALPAAVWEREVLPARIADYGGDLIDGLCAAGEIIWWRPRAGTERTAVVAASPIAIVPRGMFAHWRCLAARNARADLDASLSPNAERVVAALSTRGALFFLELVQHTGLLRVQVEDALAELVAQGRVTADAFNGLRVLLTPQRRRQHFGAYRRRRALATFDAAGRWTLLDLGADADAVAAAPARAAAVGAASAAIAGGVRAAAVEHAAHVLLRRYGVVARAVLARETLLPTWRELTEVWRRAEARGEIRGGRFVAALSGEQYALNEAVERLRRVRRDSTSAHAITISAADPLHLHGITGAAERVPAVATQRVTYRDGAVAGTQSAGASYPFPERLLGAWRPQPGDVP
jgi:ATP-dependent Lhr-like helicase